MVKAACRDAYFHVIYKRIAAEDCSRGLQPAEELKQKNCIIWELYMWFCLKLFCFGLDFVCCVCTLLPLLYFSVYKLHHFELHYTLKGALWSRKIYQFLICLLTHIPLKSSSAGRQGRRCPDKEERA